LLGAAAIAAFGLISVVVAAEAEARPFELGLTDAVFSSADAGERAIWLDRAAEVGAQSVLPSAQWAGIAPADPSGAFDPADPADAEYDFSEADAAVRDARARGLDPMLLVTGAPLWAEGENRPSDTSRARLGTWKPKPAELREFAKAVARRYSGSFDDPGDGAGVLPRVRDFQLWAEPNLSTYLTPQFRGKKPVGARHYRRMLRAFYTGVHSVSERNRVVTGGTSPYGDVPGNGAGRTAPALFWREVLCLKGERLKKRPCRKPARFDVLAHHPINVGNPRRRALNADDASTPDIGKLRQILGKAQRSGRALPRKPKKPIWATEIWWDSRPPDPNGVPERKHARWLVQSLYLLWQQRVERVVWFLIRDQAENGNFAIGGQSGLYTHEGEPKLARRAFAFPFVADRRRGKVKLWGVAPGKGKVQIERKRGGEWRRMKAVRAKGGSRVFVGTATVPRRAKLRAVQGGKRSVPYDNQVKRAQAGG
jgi:hypothetical protein